MKKNIEKIRIHLLRLVISALFLAVAMVLPFLTGQIQTIGEMLCPMHLPILLCGFVCGWPWGLVVGAVAPILRFMLFGMPPIMPVGIPMAFELAAYGCFAGLLYRLLPKKVPFIYIDLVAAMVIGRIVWGAAKYIIAVSTQSQFTMQSFIDGAILTAIPGIIIQLILVPVIFLALRKAKLTLNE